MDKRRNTKAALKRKVEESSSEDSADEGPDVELEDEGTVDVNFELFNPKESDFHTIKIFLKQYLDGTQYNSTELADMICEQGKKEFLGSVIKVSSDEITSTVIEEDNKKKQADEFFNEGFGFISVINLHKNKEKESVKQIKNHLLSKVKDVVKKKQLEKLFEDESESLGLIINERMVNVPPELATPMHKALYEEIQWAHEDEDDPKKSPWSFSNYLLVTSTYTESSADDKPPKKGKKKQKAKPISSETFYFKPEDEVYEKESFFSYGYPMVVDDTADRWTLGCMVSQKRLILAFSASKVESILKQITELIPLPN